jgi:hypothetical protein
MVAKRGLDKKTVDGIKGLPKVERKDDGGVSGDNQTESATGVSTGNDQAYAPDLTDTSAAPEDDSATNGMTPEQVAMYQKYGISPITAPTDVSATTAPDNTASPATSDQVPMASAANPNTSSIVSGGNQDTSTGGEYGPLAGAYGEAYGQASQAIKDAEDARKAGNTQTQTALTNLQSGMAASQTRTDANHADWKAKDDQLMADFQSGKVDPNRVWSNTSTGNKIIAGIGVLLSGIGSGLTGQPNMAMKVINDTIDKDIDAQKNNLGKTATLLEMNYRRYGNMQSAEAATRATLIGTAQTQLQGIAANTQNGIAAANAKTALAQLSMQKAQMEQNAWIFGRKNEVMNSGGGGSVIRSPAEAQMLFPNQWIDLGPGAGIRVARSPEALKNVADFKQHADTVTGTLDDMTGFMNQVGTAWTPANRAKAEALRAQAVSEVNELADTKRISEADMELVNKQIGNPGAFLQSDAAARIATTRKMIQNRANAVYGANLINYSPGTVSGVSTPGIK